MYFVFCLIVVPLPPGKIPFAAQLNNNNNNNSNFFRKGKMDSKYGLQKKTLNRPRVMITFNHYLFLLIFSIHYVVRVGLRTKSHQSRRWMKRESLGGIKVAESRGQMQDFHFQGSV
jgi:hypothetical protein